MATRAFILIFSLVIGSIAAPHAHSAENCKTVLAQLFEQNRKPLFSDEELKSIHSWFQGPGSQYAPRRLYEALIEKQMATASPKIREAVDRLYRRQYFRIIENDPENFKGVYYSSASDLKYDSHQIQILMEENLFETAEEFMLLTHEMRHAVQRLSVLEKGLKTDRRFSSLSLLRELDSIQAEWQYARSLPPQYRKEVIALLEKSKLPLDIKKTSIQLLSDPDRLTVQHFKKIRSARGYRSIVVDEKIIVAGSSFMVALIACGIMTETSSEETWYYQNVCRRLHP